MITILSRATCRQYDQPAATPSRSRPLTMPTVLTQSPALHTGDLRVLTLAAPGPVSTTDDVTCKGFFRLRWLLAGHPRPVVQPFIRSANNRHMVLSYQLSVRIWTPTSVNWYGWLCWQAQ
jgi:hypothetical protein